MSTHFICQTGADRDDCVQRPTTNAYLATGQTGLQVAATTAVVGATIYAGIRFIGAIPAGTVRVPSMTITGYTGASTTSTCPPVVIRTQIPTSQSAVATGPNQFKAATPVGADDLTSASGTSGRVFGTATTTYTHTTGANTNFTITIDPLQVKEMMVAAGATFTGADPLVADAPGTVVAFTNPTFRLETADLAPGASPSILTFQMRAHDQVTAAADSDKAILQVQLPTLTFDAIPAEPLIVGDDERVHIMLITDSIGWGLGNGFTTPYKIPQCRVSLGYILGTLDTVGLLELTDTSWDTVPAGESYGGVNRGYATLQDPASGLWLQVTDPKGDGGHGALLPEARSGYTEKGVLKDRILSELKANDRDVVIHSFVYGGTTIRNVGTSTGTWASTQPHGVAEVLLSTITDYSDLSSITNPLWTKNYDLGGQNALDVLRDPTIKKLMVVVIGGFNDALSSDYFAYGGNMVFPLSKNNPTDLTAFTNRTEEGYEVVFDFIKGVRDYYATLPDYVHEEHLLGYHNFVTHDPRIPTRHFNEGAPPLAALHQGSYTTVAGHLDAWYGGPNGDQPVGGVPGNPPAMAPFGNTSTDTACSPGPGQPNVAPTIPPFFAYGGQNIPVIGGQIPVAATNLAGGLPVPRPNPRAMNKDDLGFTLNLKMGNYAGATFTKEINDTSSSGYGWWFSHAAADHYGGTPGGQPATTTGWNNAVGIFLGPFMSSYPYSSMCQENLPWNNFGLVVSYCMRNVHTDTFNAIGRDLIKPAAETAVANLQAAGHQIHYIDMGDSLGTAYGTGDTASGDLSTTLDGVHLTHSGSITFNNAYIDRALAQDSELMGDLAARGLEPMMFAMM